MVTKDNPLDFVKPYTVSATPDIPIAIPSSLGNSIKPATPDLIQFNDEVIPIAYMQDLLFEQVGGQEIMSISRNDTINGQNIRYTPIKNTSQLSVSYSPKNLFAITDTTSSYFNNYSINFAEKVPEVGSNEKENQVKEIVYVDETNGDVIVNVINMRTGEQVEINVVNSVNQVSDILY
jgi:hypothetical protein